MIGSLSGYQKVWFRHDLLAGVSVAAVALPIAIAYSQLAGVPPVYGLYSSLLPLVAYAFLGSSRQLIVAPDAATCALVAAVVAPLAGPDPGRYVSLTAALAMIAGVFCIAAGLARLGFITNLLARPILTGYLNLVKIFELALQCEQILFQPVFKGSHVGMAALAFAGFTVCQQQVIPGTKLVVHHNDRWSHIEVQAKIASLA